MGERKKVLSGDSKKYLNEIILTKSEDELYQKVAEKLSINAGYQPAKWQLNSLIFNAGLKALEQKLKNVHAPAQLA